MRHVSAEGMLHGATLKLLQSLHEKSCRVTGPLIDKRLADTRVSERHLTERRLMTKYSTDKQGRREPELAPGHNLRAGPLRYF